MMITITRENVTIGCRVKDSIDVAVGDLAFVLTPEEAKALNEALSACLTARLYLP